MSAPRQDEFGGGIYRSPRAPAGCVYDCVNGLIDDELAIYRRGGVSYRSNADVGGGLSIVGVADGLLPSVGARTAFWTGPGGQMFALDPTDDATPVLVLSATPPVQPFAKAWGSHGLMVLASALDGQVVLWGGSLKATYTTGTISVTAGSKTVTGAGTAWLANADAGMLLNSYLTVDKVASNTQLELREPWGGTTGSGLTYQLAGSLAFTPVPVAALGAIPVGTFHVVTVGNAPGRIVVTAGSRAYFSSFAGDFGGAGFAATDYHEIPPPGQIIGADAASDTLVLFTTTGVWTASNMNLDLTSSTGDPQQTLQQVNKDIVAWGNSGVAGFSPYSGVQDWQGQFVVPALDDIYIFGVNSPAISIGRGIRSLYRSYVAQGYQPGLATVYQGHYILPIRTSGFDVVDTLVCRLDQRDRTGHIRPAWTRMDGQGRQLVFTGRARATGAPSLVGGRALRLVDATSWFSPSGASRQDADGTAHALDVIENDVEFPNRATTQKVDLLYELSAFLTDDPAFLGSWSSGVEGAPWTPLSTSAGENDGRVPKRWRLIKRVRNVRFRWQTFGPAATARIRGRVLYVRDSNRP